MKRKSKAPLVRCGAAMVFAFVSFTPVFSAEPSQADRQGWERISKLGSGFVAWESNRTGSWRIWTRKLDGSNERVLSPEEAGRDHVCPTISPTGEWVAYISLPRGTGYNEVRKPATAPLRLIRTDGTGDRVLVPDCRRISGGNRGIVWYASDRLFYLDSQGYARSICTADSEPGQALTDEPGFIPNATATYVYDRHHIYPFNLKKRSFRRTGPELSGCEPAFTQDGRWSVRVSGAGGPINRIDPVTLEAHTLLKRNDPNNADGRGYIYFPSVSPCGRLLAWGASPGQHDHESGDYDIFIAEINPETLDISGTPVRYSFDPKTDRYPCVFVSDYPLGRFIGEAPLTVDFKMPDGEIAKWDSGDGATGGGTTFRHRYYDPGEYRPTAVSAKGKLKALVTVLPATAPKVLDVSVRGRRTIDVVFDEPVDISRIRYSLASRTSLSAGKLSEDGRTLCFTLAADVPLKDTLSLSGVRDLAQMQNEMTPGMFQLRGVRWPLSTYPLFAWTSGQQPMLRQGAIDFAEVDGESGGLARSDRNFSKMLTGGCHSFPGTGPKVVSALKASNAFSIEVALRSADTQQNGPSRIITLSRNTVSRNFTLGQERDKFILRVRTPNTGENGVNPETAFAQVDTTRDQHLLITYEPGKMVVYEDGKELMRSDRVKGDFSNWEPMEMRVGDELTNDRDWHGRLDMVLIYDRALTPEEAADSAETWKKIQADIPQVKSVKAKLKVTAVSPMPTLGQVAPYREGLVMIEAEVMESEPVNALPDRVRVAMWAILDAKLVRTAALSPEDTATMTLEPLSSQPQVKDLFTSDTLEFDATVPLYLRVD